MKLVGITDQEFMNKLNKAVKSETKASNDGFEVYHLVRVDVRKQDILISISDYVNERIELMGNSFIQEKAKALKFGESEKKLSIGYIGIDGVNSNEFANEFICNHNLELDDIISDNLIIIETKAPVLLYKKGLIDGIELMELPIIIALELQ